jgi:hypothetical protein
MPRLSRLIVLLAIASATHAQGPSAQWRTITTAHFRVHYPASYETWATAAASRLESIRAAVTKEVGFEPPQTIDVIVANPIAQANGAAYSLLDTPRIVFFTDPPAPDEQIGAYSTWIDLLATHEVTHIVHLLRPSRNPAERIVERLILPLAPITLDAPRWVLEGYATVVEGRLTGAGRPPSTMRAVILREWASTGRMPSYSQLNSDTRFLGMSMAYLAGSAYLEWLERRTGQGSLRRLWARMTARQRRTFPAAFIGVFGDTPERLYGRFVAELTSSAIAVNRASELREGELWQETARASGDPAVSPDGSQITIVVRPRNEPPRIVILSTAPPDEERAKFDERITEIIRRDPEDVAPVSAKPLPRKILHSFRLPDGGDIETPRWTAGGSILYTHRQPDREGFLHRDLFLWNPSAPENRRVTHLADVSDADPFPDGQSAIAVRSRYGLTQLVRVDLGTGAVTALTEPSLETVYSHPRVSRDGTQIAYVAHSAGGWSLFRSAAAGAAALVDTKAVALPAHSENIASPEWSGDEIIATILSGGFAELYRVSADGSLQPLTRSSGGAFQPAPAIDGRIFFMGLDPDGFVIRVIDGKTPAPAPPPYDPTLVPAVPPILPVPAPFVSQPVPSSRPYGIGRQEAGWFAGETFAPSQDALEIGARLGDVIGRLDTIAIASIGHQNGQRGVAVASVWRGWPVELAGHAFHANDDLVKRSGVELRASWSAEAPLMALRVEAGGLTGSPIDLTFADASLRVRQVLSSWRTEEEVRLSGEAGSVRHFRGVARGSLRHGAFSVVGRYQHDQSRGNAGVEVGGVPSSILPLSAIPNRVLDPALPVATLRGRRYDSARIETTLPAFPATFFYQRHRADRASVSVAGMQMTFGSEPQPLIRYPGLDFTAGVARILDEPLRNRTKWWLSMRWRP